MKVTEIIEGALTKWHEEDKNNRSFLIITNEPVKGGEYEITVSLMGMRRPLVTSTAQALKDNDNLARIIADAYLLLKLHNAHNGSEDE